MTDSFSLIAVFGGMLFLVWILPGMVCRKGSFPEDSAQGQRALRLRHAR